MAEEFSGSIDDLKALIQTKGPVCLVCYGPWCPTCRRLEHLLPGIMELCPKLPFIRMDVNANKDTAKELAIAVIPTVRVLNLEDGNINMCVSHDGSKFDELKAKLLEVHEQL